VERKGRGGGLTRDEGGEGGVEKERGKEGLFVLAGVGKEAEQTKG